MHGNVIQKRVVDGGLGCLSGTAFAGCLAGAHHRLAHLAHHRTDVGKIEVDLTRLDHQVGHSGNTLMQHCVRHMEGIGEGGALIRQTEQVLVRNDDQRVDIGLHLLDAGLGLSHAALSLEIKGFCHHTDGEDAPLARGAGNHRRGAGACAAAHAGGDEHHVAICKLAHHGFNALLGGGASDIRL